MHSTWLVAARAAALCWLFACVACGDDSGDAGGADAAAPAVDGASGDGDGADGDDVFPYGIPWATPFDATEVGWLMSVWGPRADLLFVAGGGPDDGVIMRVEGDDWSEMALPEGTPGLHWVFGFGHDDVWSVGRQGTILHYDGEAWQAQDSPVERDLWGVWGARPDALWAVGGNGAEEGQATLLRFDGTAWTEETLIALERERVWALFKVWGAAEDDVYVVGQRGAVLHYDGSAWSELDVGIDRDLIALWGTGPDRIVMVGGRAGARVATWDGAQWRGETLSPLPGLNGIWMRDPNVIHAVGAENTLVTIDFDTLAYEEEDSQERVRIDFHAVFGDDSGRLTAVGGNLKMASGPYRGITRTRQLDAGE